MVFVPLVAGRWMPATRKDVGGAACHEHGAVFASAARVPLTSVASVVEMTGDFTLTLPVMLDVEIVTSRGLSYGAIYTPSCCAAAPTSIASRPRRGSRR
jgi:H+/Cl- antiporter ClcA